MSARTFASPVVVLALLLASAAGVATAQIRMSQPKPTGQGPSSGVDPDSGAGGAEPAAAAPAAPTASQPLVAPTGEGTDALDAEEGDADMPRSGYDPEGRRDPFRPLTGEAADSDERKKFEHTLFGRLLAEVKLTSIVKTSRGNIATFEGGPTKEGYFAHVGDKFWDGQVIEINYESKTVVVRQQLNDPRLIKTYRDQVIPLYSDADVESGGAPRPGD